MEHWAAQTGGKPFEQLPPETELAESFELSRVTVRQALSRLCTEGFIERRHGIGTFVLPRRVAVQHDLNLSSSWRERFEKEGHKTSSILLEASSQSYIPAELFDGLEPLEVVGEASFVKRLHLVDAQPIGVTESWVPAEVAPGITERPLDQGSLSVTLNNRYGRTALTVDNMLETVLATPTDAKLLEIVTDIPMFVVSSVSRQKGGELLEVSRSVWVGGRVRFHSLQHSDQFDAETA